MKCLTVILPVVVGPHLCEAQLIFTTPPVTNHFPDAWALAQPYPTLDGLHWTTLERANVEARFGAGENRIVVSYSSDAGTYTVIERF